MDAADARALHDDGSSDYAEARSADGAEGSDTWLGFVQESLHVENEIRERAYEIFLARDDASGDALSDWLEAERLVRHRRDPDQPLA
jgi:hypothetical protein